MIKMLSKHGNSRALVLDKAVLDLLNIDDDTPLEITTDGTRLVVEPLRDQRRTEVEASLTKMKSRYGRMLKNLA
jgi:antitoxin component of MazEF toxin-antitoxin module